MGRMQVAIALGIALILVAGVCAAAQEKNKTLDIYFLDMAGGASTLIVTPLGESVLIDTGSLEPKHRDVDRICRACADAGVTDIDYLVTTHFYVDHYGGILELSKRIPIKTFIDNDTPPVRYKQRQAFDKLNSLYEEATKGKTKLLSAGEDIPLKKSANGPQLTLHCVASQKKIEGFAGDIDAPVEGFEIRKPDTSNNAHSIAVVLTYGKFKFFAGGDITWNVEHHLAHPTKDVTRLPPGPTSSAANRTFSRGQPCSTNAPVPTTILPPRHGLVLRGRPEPGRPPLCHPSSKPSRPASGPSFRR